MRVILIALIVCSLFYSPVHSETVVKKINNNCELHISDNIPSGCWCSGPEAKSINNTQQSNGKQGGNEQDGIRIELMSSLSAPSNDQKICSFKGFIKPNTYFSKKVSTCFDPECGGSYKRIRTYIYKPSNKELLLNNVNKTDATNIKDKQESRQDNEIPERGNNLIPPSVMANPNADNDRDFSPQQPDNDNVDCFVNALKEGAIDKAKDIIEMYVKACEVAVSFPKKIKNFNFCRTAFGQPYNTGQSLNEIGYEEYLEYINLKIDLEVDIKDLERSKINIEVVDKSEGYTCINVNKYLYKESLKIGLNSPGCLKNADEVDNNKQWWLEKIDSEILGKLRKIKEITKIVNNSYPSNACSPIDRSILEARLKDLELEAASAGSYAKDGCFTKKVFFIDKYKDGKNMGRSKFGCSTQRDLNKALAGIKREIRHIKLALSLAQKQPKLCSC